MFRGECLGQRQFLRTHRDHAGLWYGGNGAGVKGAEKSGAQNANPQH
jgi:hypothetical protein